MKRDELLDRFACLTIWSRAGQRAPHKPLLLLMAFARIAANKPRDVPYHEVDEKLRDLLIEFGPTRASHHPEYPFVRLQNDGVWVVRDADRMKRRTGSNDILRSELIRYDAVGHFSDEVYSALAADRTLLYEAATTILAAHFPSSLHEDILTAVGLEIRRFTTVKRSVRDPEFRVKVLRAYDNRCCICGFDLRVASHSVAIEAAHIKWHQAGGPDVQQNGFAMCVLHHKLFDRGMFTVTPERSVKVSSMVKGSKRALNESLLRHRGQPVGDPVSPEFRCDPKYLAWHEKEVFRRPHDAMGR